jgi:ATP-dependent RNA helicase RhlE
MHFSELSLSPVLLRALSHEGYTTPTPIQSKAIPPALAGRDVLGCAQTGTGKTAAFALPLIQRLMSEPVDKTQREARSARALILSPTRELASQIGDSIAAYGRESGIVHTTIYGGVSQFHQERALRRGVDVIVATPGRLIDLMEQGLVDLSRVRILVLDEADRMLDMGFIQPIRRIAAATMPAGKRQTMLFSATMPKEIVRLAESLLRDPARVAVENVAATTPKIEQSVFMVDRKRKQDLLETLLEDRSITRAVVFTRTKHGADRVGKRLFQAGVRAETIHGNKAQNQRKKALERFRAGHARVLVATDVAARGLDVDGISHVINFDLPVEAEAYVHRIGRTGRAGATGIAFAFCDAEERGLLKDIERLIGTKVRVEVRGDTTGPRAVSAAPQARDADEQPEPESRPAPRPQHTPQRPQRTSHSARPQQGGSGGRPKFAGAKPGGGGFRGGKSWNAPRRRSTR